jgi:predicted nucleotidyltransferase component of viral defense system
MRKNFAEAVARQNGIAQADLVEKDLILHQILTDLSQDTYFSNNFTFKGGTCLTKCYLGYYRFSEDIDFTWKDQSVYSSKSQNKIRRFLSDTIDKVGSIFEEIAKKRILDFKCDKQDRRYVELGGSNKMCTFKIWYQAETLNVESFVKVQMNFVEKLIFPSHKGTLCSLQCKQSDELSFLFSEYVEYFQTTSLFVYDVREILCEKVRSILTREGFKARDFFDIYFICRKFSLKLEDLFEFILEKINVALGMYWKYKSNFSVKKSVVLSLELFRWGEEKRFLLQKIDEKEFNEFLDNLQMFLKKVVKEISVNHTQ